MDGLILKVALLVLASLLLVAFANKFDKPREYVLISIDTERDIVPILNTYKGVDEGLPYLLKLLDKKGIKASFFVTGRVAEERQEMVRTLAEKGHELCGHAFDHENLTGRSAEEIKVIVERTIDAIEDVSGVRINCFRAPYHSTTPKLVQVLSELGIVIEGSHVADYPHMIEGTNVTRVTSSPLLYPSTTYPNSWLSFYEWTLRIQENKTPKIIIIGLHSWELVDMPETEGYEEYAVPSGNYTRTEMESLINYLRRRGNVVFTTFSEIMEVIP